MKKNKFIKIYFKIKFLLSKKIIFLINFIIFIFYIIINNRKTLIIIFEFCVNEINIKKNYIYLLIKFIHLTSNYKFIYLFFTP